MINIFGAFTWLIWLLAGAFQAVSEGSLVGKVLVLATGVGIAVAWIQELRRNP